MENIVSSTRQVMKKAVLESFVNANVSAGIVDPVTGFSLVEPLEIGAVLSILLHSNTKQPW